MKDNSIFKKGQVVTLQHIELCAIKLYPGTHDPSILNENKLLTSFQINDVIYTTVDYNKKYWCEPFMYKLDGIPNATFPAEMFKENVNFFSTERGVYEDCPECILKLVWKNTVELTIRSANMKYLKDAYPSQIFDITRSPEGKYFWLEVDSILLKRDCSTKKEDLIKLHKSLINIKGYEQDSKTELCGEEANCEGRNLTEGSILHGRTNKASIILESLAYTGIIRES